MGDVSEQVLRFAARIERVRRTRGLSQQELADLAGLSRQALGKMETGQQGIRLGDAIAITKALGVSIEEMISAGPLSLIIRVPVD